MFLSGGFLKQVEKAKQDDALLDLSNILGELKVMAVDMGSEIERSVAFCLLDKNYSYHLCLSQQVNLLSPLL